MNIKSAAPYTMTAQQLADELARMIRAGEISPETPVVRKFCMCDEDYGWVTVKTIDLIRPDPDAMFGGATASGPELSIKLT